MHAVLECTRPLIGQVTDNLTDRTLGLVTDNLTDRTLGLVTDNLTDRTLGLVTDKLTGSTLKEQLDVMWTFFFTSADGDFQECSHADRDSRIHVSPTEVAQWPGHGCHDEAHAKSHLDSTAKQRRAPRQREGGLHGD